MNTAPLTRIRYKVWSKLIGCVQHAVHLKLQLHTLLVLRAVLGCLAGLQQPSASLPPVLLPELHHANHDLST